MKKIYLSSLIAIALCACANNDVSESNVNETNVIESEKKENPIVTINLSNGKHISCELYPDIAPISVNNFLNLVDDDFYDGLVFHRIIPQFMIQTGGFYINENTVYRKESPITIKGEFSSNGIENNLKHTPGVLSMARSNDNNSASSQFFICVETCSWLDGSYAAFGKTIDEESLNVAIEISKMSTCTVGGVLENFPIEPISITNIERN